MAVAHRPRMVVGHVACRCCVRLVAAMTPSEIQEAARLAFLEAGVEIPDEWDIRYRPLYDEPGFRGSVGLWSGPGGV